MTSLMKYFGVVKRLDTTTPKNGIVRLHDAVYQMFNTKNPYYELTITFDDKKINIDSIDDVHRLVRVILDSYSDFGYFVMREWSRDGCGRLHYHGIIQQYRGGQTQLAKLKSQLKRIFGRDCRVNYISFLESYISYILKRTVKEMLLLETEWFSSNLIHSYLYENDIESHYTFEQLKDFQKKRTEKK